MCDVDVAAGQEQGALLKSMPRRGRFHLSAGSSQLSKGDLYADGLCDLSTRVFSKCSGNTDGGATLPGHQRIIQRGGDFF